jgi:cell division transport system permease protein
MAEARLSPIGRLSYFVKRQMPQSALPNLRVVNSDSIANRALVAVVAIMAFLAALAGSAASMIQSAAQDWSGAITNEITIQIKPAAGRDLFKDQMRAVDIANKFPGIEKAAPLSRTDSAELLTPWLGAGFEITDLPIPQLITAKISRTERVDITALSKALKAEIPNAIVDDHKVWRDRLQSMSNNLLSIVFFFLCLFVLAMGLAVSFATRGAMASSRDIVEVLHFVGASDAFIAKEFQRHFLQIGLFGASIGSACALLFIWAMDAVSQRFSNASTEQVEALFGRMEVQSGLILVILFITLIMAGVTSAVSRVVASNLLRRNFQE